MFELSPPSAGQTAWTQTVIYRFVDTSKSPGCSNPWTGVVMDASGVLYGTTLQGGTMESGCVFSLTPPAAGQTSWTETNLHSFQYVTNNGSTDGGEPWGVVLDRAGNLYGGTFEGGEDGVGTVYELSPPAAGQTAWTETELYSFPSSGAQGLRPEGLLTLDSSGAIYGTTVVGGASPASAGVVFKLTPPAAGQTGWTESVLFNFDGTNGNGDEGFQDTAGLLVSASGALYGTASGNYMTYHNGLIYRLDPPAAGQTLWSETVLYRFQDKQDGAVPVSGLTQDPAGNLYGTATEGGGTCAVDPNGCGTVYEGFSR